jgi:hypothetical protein
MKKSLIMGALMAATAMSVNAEDSIPQFKGVLTHGDVGVCGDGKTWDVPREGSKKCVVNTAFLGDRILTTTVCAFEWNRETWRRIHALSIDKNDAPANTAVLTVTEYKEQHPNDKTYDCEYTGTMVRRTKK